MAGQSGDEGPDVVAVAGPQADWVRERASALDLDPAEYLDRIVVSLRAVEAGDPLDDLALAGDFEALERRIETVDESTTEKIADVRERVIQVKREADEKAPADHDHPDLETAVEEALGRVKSANNQVEAIGETVETIERRLERGFDNYEEILTYLVDRTDAFADHVETLAGATTALQGELATLADQVHRNQATARLKKTANTEGITSAACADCGATVTVALLTEPACPFCGASFASIEPKRGFFGSATLETGRVPALEEPTDEDATPPTESDLEAMLADVGDGAAEAARDRLDRRDSVVDVESSPTDGGTDTDV